MRIVLAGGTGQIGTILTRAFGPAGHELVVLTRRPAEAGQVYWDSATLGPWAGAVDGSDVVINLAGRSVSCRYTPASLQAMMDSRVNSARVVGAAIAQAARPPRAWLQMSTATIYAHRLDAANDEAAGIIGGAEPGVPPYWEYSVRIARRWEQAQQQAVVPATRKVALRTAFVVSPDRGGAFDVLSRLSRLSRLGLGGPVAGGGQYVSWIHEADFVRAVEFLIDREDLAGPVNAAAPAPLPQREFMAALRAAWGMPIGLPATRWMAEIGALALGSDTELLLQSRQVVPGRLLAAGFTFSYPDWPEAARDLAGQVRGQRPVRLGALRRH